MYKTLHKKQGSVTVQLRFARSSVTFCAKRDTNPPPDRTKHGGYVPVFMDALDSDEQELLGSIPEDTELQLMEQIQLFFD